MVDEAHEARAEGARQPEPAAAASKARRTTCRSTRRCRATVELRPGRARACGASRASTSARRRACSAPATSRRPTRRPARANSEGLFAYYQYAEAGFILTCRTPDGGGSGWAGITGVKDICADRRRRSSPRSPPTRRSRARSRARSSRAATPSILEPRADGALPLADDGRLQRRGGGGGGGVAAATSAARQPSNADGTPKIGEKLFSDSFTLKSDIGNPILRQTPIMHDGTPAQAGDLGREGRAEEPLLRPATARRAEEGRRRRQRRT